MIVLPTIIILTFHLVTLNAVKGQVQPEVKIHQGVVRGVYTSTPSGRKIASFKGIPYAKPPVGNARFKQAEAADSWLGVLNATTTPDACLQLDHFHLNTEFEIHGSEDCLYINVFTPTQLSENNNNNNMLDVIVFIHGGAFMFLSSSYFGSSILLERDIVLVTLNYRLGPLGFLSTEDSVLPGNNGLKDQVLALKWVQQNIAAFGGNPASVTIAGMSAGGVSVHFHLLSNLSRGLFKNAIVMSGVSLNPWALMKAGREKTEYIASQLGCPTIDSNLLLDCLKSRPASQIVGLSRHFLKWLYNPFTPFGPTVEPDNKSAFLSEQPISILRQRKAADVPILASFAADEGIYPGGQIVNDDNLQKLKVSWDDLLPHILDYNYTLPSSETLHINRLIRDEYKINLDKNEGIKNFITMIGDRLFLHGIIKALLMHGKDNKSPTYVYKFSHLGKFSGTQFFNKKLIGVSHGDDLFYILYSKLIDTQASKLDKRLSEQMVDLWVSFAANGSLRDPWKPISKSLPRIAYTDITGPDSFLEKEEDFSTLTHFWDSLGLNDLSLQESCSSEISCKGTT